MINKWNRWYANSFDQERRNAHAYGSLVLIDQGIVSVANFLTTVLIGRACGKYELGVYALGFSIVVMMAGLPKSLIWTPYTTFSPHLKGTPRKEYNASVTVLLALLAILMAMILAIIGGVAISFPTIFEKPTTGYLLLWMVPFIFFMQIREHMRRLCLASMQVKKMLAVDTLVSILQVGGIYLAAQKDWLTGSNAYLALMISCTVSLGWFYKQRADFSFHDLKIKEAIIKNWNFARWIFGGAVAVMLSQAIYRWVLTAVHGYDAMGELAPAQSIIFFANPILLGVANYIGPIAANTYAESGIGRLLKVTRTNSFGYLLFCSCFFLLIILGGEPLIGLIYGDDFSGKPEVIFSLGLGLLSEAMLVPIESAFYAINRGHVLFFTANVRLAITVTFGATFVYFMGPVGVGYGMLLGNVLAFIWQWITFYKIAKIA